MKCTPKLTCKKSSTFDCELSYTDNTFDGTPSVSSFALSCVADALDGFFVGVGIIFSIYLFYYDAKNSNFHLK